MSGIGKLFGGGAAPPPPPPPVPMPDLGDPAILAAQKRVAADAASRSGRASTVLSGADGNYSGTKLGAA